MRNKVKTVCEHDALRNGQVRKINKQILLNRHVIAILDLIYYALFMQIKQLSVSNNLIGKFLFKKCDCNKIRYWHNLS